MAEPRSLYQAAAEGNLERVRELLNCGEPVDQRNVFRESLEQTGTGFSEEKRDQRLLCRRLTRDETDQEGWTPLHVAAYCRNVEIVRMLLARDTDINERIQVEILFWKLRHVEAMWRCLSFWSSKGRR